MLAVTFAEKSKVCCTVNEIIISMGHEHFCTTTHHHGHHRTHHRYHPALALGMRTRRNYSGEEMTLIQIPLRKIQ